MAYSLPIPADTALRRKGERAVEIVARIVGLIVSIGIPVFMVIRAHFMYKRPVPLRQLKSKTWLWGGCYLVLAAIFSFGWSAFGPGDVLAPSQVIMSALVLIVGCLCVHYYGNYFVDIYPDRVVYRKLTRQVHVIEYKDIRYHCIRRNNGDRVLRIRSRSGQMFQMSIVKFNGGALLDYVRWLDSLTEGAEKNFPGAPHQQIEREKDVEQ